MKERQGLLPAPEARAVRPAPQPAAQQTVTGITQAAPPVPGLDIQVNDSSLDTAESTTQSETSMAVLGNTICAGYNDSGTNRYSGLARSTDLGATWTDLGEIGQRGDPVIAVHDDSGAFYYAEIATIGGNPAIGVAISTDDCMSFGAPVDASPVASGHRYHHAERQAVDRRRQQRRRERRQRLRLLDPLLQRRQRAALLALDGRRGDIHRRTDPRGHRHRAVRLQRRRRLQRQAWPSPGRIETVRRKTISGSLARPMPARPSRRRSPQPPGIVIRVPIASSAAVAATARR